MQDAKEEVRARLNIEDVIGEYVQLKRAGRNFKGLSPFTGEKTPSFTVSPDKQIYKCFCYLQLFYENYSSTFFSAINN